MEQKFKKYLLYYSAGAGIVFLAVMLLYTGFNLSAPLDDAFIYFQYAKNMAAGHFFEYVIGDGYTSGATSALYVFLLTPFALIFRGASLILVTYLFGIVCLYFSGYYIYKIALKLSGKEPAAFFTAILFVTNGNILWGYFSGMEICVFSALLAACLYHIAYSSATWKQVVFLSLLSMVRPEGFMIVSVFVFVKFAGKIFGSKEPVLPFIIPVLAGFSYFLMNRVFTGDFMPNTMRAKSNFSANHMYYTEVLRQGLQYYMDFFKMIFNGENEHYFPRYSYFFFLLGLLPGIIGEIREKKSGLFTASFIFFFLGILSTMFSSFATVHNYRYMMPFIIIFGIFMVYGLNMAVDRVHIGNKRAASVFTAAVVSLLVIFNVFTVIANMVNFGRDCRDIYHQSISAGKWVKQNIPHDERVAINDVGAITYFSDAKIIDLVGLVTNGQARKFRDGIGVVFEELEHLRPKYWMVHLGWFNYEGFTVFKKPRMTTFNIDKEPAYFVVGSPEVGVETDFSLFGSGDTMKQDHSEKGRFVQADALDVADMRDEDKHGYSIHAQRIPLVPGTLFEEDVTGNSTEKLIDAGRETGGGEIFNASGLRAGSDMKIVKRTFNASECSVDVYVDGVKSGVWEIKNMPVYSEQEFVIPGGMIKKDRVQLRFELSKGSQFNSFYYWILQRR